MPLGVTELVVIFLIILVLFGSSKLPRLGRGLGEGIRNFRTGLKGNSTDTKEVDGGEPNSPS